MNQIVNSFHWMLINHYLQLEIIVMVTIQIEGLRYQQLWQTYGKFSNIIKTISITKTMPLWGQNHIWYLEKPPKIILGHNLFIYF